MRHLRFPLIAAVLFATTTPTFAQPAIPFADAGVHAVQFIDENEGWAVGDDGVVWHSMDGGKAWERQKTGTRASLRGVHFLTPYTGWAVGRVESPCGAGSVGVMLRTTDGGIKWDEVGMNVLPGLNAVRFFNENSGIVYGDGSDAFPSGMFLTNDAGKTWSAIKGPRLASVRCVDQRGSQFVGGAWGALGRLKSEVVWTPPVKGGVKEAQPFGPFQFVAADTDPLGGRSVNGIAVGETATFAACDGGAVLTSSDTEKSWGFVNLGLPPAALAACDFKAVAAVGKHVWVAGKPGGFVLHSADAGKTWEVQKTELTMPINGMSFLNEKVGFLVGELGCIFGTIDGGRTWKASRAGGQRTAVLSLNASHRSVPLDVISTLGLGEGYLCAAVALMCADPATADPKRASDADRLRNGMRLAGGATGDVNWAFPVAAHTAGLPPRELLASWDRRHGGKATEHLLRQAVCAIRTWQPEVILADLVVENGSSADVLALHMAKEAFAKAADPNAFPEQITTLGLKPWTAKKLYALAPHAKGAPVLIDQSIYSTALADSPKDYAEPAIRVLADDSAVVDRRCFTLVAHRLEGADKHAELMQGIQLARGGVARRPDVAVVPDLEGMAEKKKAAQSRRRLETMATVADTEFAGADKILGLLGVELKKMPDDTAARTAFAVANRLARDGKWTEAREVYGLLATNYTGHPLAIEAFRWLTRFYASSEARRRTEIQQKYLLKNVTFETIPSAGGKVVQASGTSTGMAKPVVQEDVYRVYSPDAILRWHQSCLDLEPKLFAFGPVHSRDPASWLCFLAARRQVGRHTDAITFVRDYFKNTPGAATTAPGQDAWRDCLAAELWMTDRGMIAVPPKGLGYCRHTETRPLLDGKLDDSCWQDVKPMSLAPLASDDAKADEKKAFASEFKTETKFAYDEAFLYISVSCAHPTGMKAEPVAKRTRDADMTGHDRVDILLDLDRDYQTYYRLQVDHRGCLAEDCWGDKTWNPKYFAAFNATETGWTAEIAIPLVELTSDRPAHGRTWAANVSRVIPGKGIQSWNGPADDTPRPEGMGLLQFRSDSK